MKQKVVMLFTAIIILNPFGKATAQKDWIDRTIIIENLEVAKYAESEDTWEDAIKFCIDIGKGWHLPTKEELNILYKNKDKIKYKNYIYWSSTEADSQYAWAQSLSDGEQGKNKKNTIRTYFPVRTVEEKRKWEITISYPEMITVEGGTFTMGDTEMEGEEIELPIHKVTLKTFKIAKTETTVLQYKVYCDATSTKMPPSPIYGFTDSNPIVNVSYEEVMGYCNWLSKKTGKLYRLPTEAEWEYAARGGNKSKGYKYSGGQKLDFVGWYDDGLRSEESSVGLKKPNELDLYDMSGNVFEWCLDWFGEYKASPETNPKGASTGFGRVLRGGSYNLPATNCRVAARTSNEPDFRFDFAGFRVVLVE